MIEIKVKGESVKMDDNYHANILEAKQMIDEAFDQVWVFDGMEGSGKSELAIETCLVADKSFCADDVFYTVDQFEDWLDNAKPGKAGLWDEFVLAGLSTEALSKLQTVIIKKFTMIRKKRLFICLVIPYFFMLRKYFAISRPRVLVHVYTKGKQRGFFRFYTYHQKQQLYIYGYKTWMYSAKVKPAFSGRFWKWGGGMIDDEVVQARKDEAIRLVGDSMDHCKFLKGQMFYLQNMVQQAKSPFKDQQGKDHKNWYNVKKKVMSFDTE